MGGFDRGYGYGMVQRLANSQPTARGSCTLADKLNYWENAHMEALASAAAEMREVQDAGGQGAGDIAGGVGMELELEGGDELDSVPLAGASAGASADPSMDASGVGMVSEVGGEENIFSAPLAGGLDDPFKDDQMPCGTVMDDGVGMGVEMEGGEPLPAAVSPASYELPVSPGNSHAADFRPASTAAAVADLKMPSLHFSKGLDSIEGGWEKIVENSAFLPEPMQGGGDMEILEDPAPVGDGEFLENSAPIIAVLDLDLQLVDSIEVCPHNSIGFENVVIPRDSEFNKACNGLIDIFVREDPVSYSSRISENQNKHKSVKRKISEIRAELEDSVQPPPILPSKNDLKKKQKVDKKIKKELLEKEIQAKKDAKIKKAENLAPKLFSYCLKKGVPLSSQKPTTSKNLPVESQQPSTSKNWPVESVSGLSESPAQSETFKEPTKAPKASPLPRRSPRSRACKYTINSKSVQASKPIPEEASQPMLDGQASNPTPDCQASHPTPNITPSNSPSRGISTAGGQIKRAQSPSTSRAGKRRRRDVDPNITHPFFPRRCPLSQLDRELIQNPQDSSRLRWRTENYKLEEPKVTGESNTILTSANFFEDFQNQGGKILIHCSKCNAKDAVLETAGNRDIGGKYYQVTCRKCHFKHKDARNVNQNSCCGEDDCEFNGYPVHVLKQALACLTGQISYENFKQVLLNLGIKCVGRTKFYEILSILYLEQPRIFKEAVENNIKSVCDFYEKNGFKLEGGKYNITVSCDGSYTKRNQKNRYDSRFCISFVVESRTGLVIDYEVVEKCVSPDCKSKELFSMTDCPDDNFHGPSKSLEVAAAINLFSRSVDEKYPFRYKIYVGDGDSSTYKNIFERNFYGDTYPIEKEECVFHLRKSIKRQLYKVFKNIQTTVPKVGSKHKDYSELLPDDFKIKKPFANQEDRYMIRFSNLFLYVVKKCASEGKYEKTPETINKMSNSIRAIPRHYSDHRDATPEQRHKYHEYCDQSFCDYVRTPESERVKYLPKKDGEFYIAEWDDQGNPITKQMDIIWDKFDQLGSYDTCSRCCRFLNQNINESLHNRCFRMISKIKSYQKNHIIFAAHMTMNIHNYGYRRTLGRWHVHLGSYTPDEEALFAQRDKTRLENSSEEQQKRKKKSFFKNKDPLKDEEVRYCPGYMFEDHPLEGAAQYSNLYEDRNEYRDVDFDHGESDSEND